MAAPQIAALPEFFTLASGMTIRLTAVSPTTGALVPGVTISGVSIDVDPGIAEAAVPAVPFAPYYSQGDVAA